MTNWWNIPKLEAAFLQCSAFLGPNRAHTGDVICHFNTWYVIDFHLGQSTKWGRREKKIEDLRDLKDFWTPAYSWKPEYLTPQSNLTEFQMSLNTLFNIIQFCHDKTCCIFSTVLAAWYLCVPGYTQLMFAVNLNSVQQDGWVGWVLGVCIIDRACTLCNHNRQVFPKIPRLARERLLFWCLPALGRSMDRTILWIL